MRILPPAQLNLWPQLAPAAKLGFVLYGGTAIGLRLGHRESVDFDFFSEQPLDQEKLKLAFPFLAQAKTLQDRDHSWVVLVPGIAEANSQPQQVKVSFFGNITFGRVAAPDCTEDGVLQVASFDDLMATKVKVVLQRAEAKDYTDIAAMIKAGVSLAHGLAAACQLFGPGFQPSESLKALLFFKDGDLANLSKNCKQTLLHAVRSIRELPKVSKIASQLTN